MKTEGEVPNTAMANINLLRRPTLERSVENWWRSARIMAKPKMLQRLQTSTILQIGQNVGFRKRLRVFLDERRVEGTIMFIVLVYFLVIVLDFSVPEIVKVVQGSFTDEYQGFIIAWSRVFWAVDFVFLSIFCIEIGMRIYAWGSAYVKDVLNFIDMVVVISSLILSIVTMEVTMFTCNDAPNFGAGCQIAESGSAAESTRVILRVFRIVRIFRIVIILNKIKRSRENAQILRKKAKYKRQGSPVERVVEILQRLRRKANATPADRENIGFIIDAIISDQLYKVRRANSTAHHSSRASCSIRHTHTQLTDLLFCCSVCLQGECLVGGHLEHDDRDVGLPAGGRCRDEQKQEDRDGGCRQGDGESWVIEEQVWQARGRQGAGRGSWEGEHDGKWPRRPRQPIELQKDAVWLRVPPARRARRRRHASE